MEPLVVDTVSTFAQAFAKGVLPWPGSMLDQSARLLLAIRLWDAAIAAYLDLPERRRKAAGG